jgi:hypothetical protein
VLAFASAVAGEPGPVEWSLEQAATPKSTAAAPMLSLRVERFISILVKMG